MSYFQKDPREKFPNLGIFGDCQNFERPWLIIRSILNSFIIQKIKIQVICDRFTFKSTIFEIRKILKKFLKLSLFRAKNEKKYKNLKSGIARLRFFSQKMPYFLARTLGNLKKYYKVYQKCLKIEVFSKEEKFY